MVVVAVGSHYDDIELGCGGTMVKYHEEGHTTYGIVVTQSNYEDRDYATAREEGEEASQVLGYHLIRLELPTRSIEYKRELVQQLDFLFSTLGADIILTHWPYDVHQDHGAVGRATITAARHRPRILLYRSNWYSTHEEFRSNFYVDITKHIVKKEKAIKCHRSEYYKNGRAWLDFFLDQNKAAARTLGYSGYAETFEVVKWLE